MSQAPLRGEDLGGSEAGALCRPPAGSGQGGRHAPAQSVHSASCIFPSRSGFLSASRPAGALEPRQVRADSHCGLWPGPRGRPSAGLAGEHTCAPPAAPKAPTGTPSAFS